MEEKNNKKEEHWTRKTKLGIYLKENEKARKIATIIIVLGVVILIVSAISGFANMDTASSHLAGAQNAGTGISQAQNQLMKYRIQAFGSIIVAILLWYYGNKITQH